MQQRAMIAMAMSCNPELLIADEPTTALDVTVQAQVLEQLNKLREDMGTALIIITHNLGVVARYADSVKIVYGGKIVEEGNTYDVFEHPHHPYTIGLINAVPRLDLPRSHGLHTIEGEPPICPPSRWTAAPLPAGANTPRKNAAPSAPAGAPGGRTLLRLLPYGRGGKGGTLMVEEKIQAPTVELPSGRRCGSCWISGSPSSPRPRPKNR